MPLGYKSMPRQSFKAQNTSTFSAVTYIWKRAEARDGRSVAFHYSYVMKHGGLRYKFPIYVKVAVARYLQGQVTHCLTVLSEDMEKARIPASIFFE